MSGPNFGISGSLAASGSAYVLGMLDLDSGTITVENDHVQYIHILYKWPI